MIQYLFIFLLHCFFICNIYGLESVCSILTKTNAQVERQLLGGGFHRKLETSLLVSTPLNLDSCYILVKEVLPSGAFCDPNELNAWKEFGGPSFFIPQFVDIEAPQQLSPKILSYFFARLQQKEAGSWYTNVTLPVHFRYHRAKHGSFEVLEERIVFPHPSIYLFCESDLEEACMQLAHLEPCPPNGVQQCDWLPVNTFSTGDWVEGRIPVGNADLIDTVLLTITTVTFGAALLLLVSIFRNTQDPSLFNRSIT